MSEARASDRPDVRRAFGEAAAFFVEVVGRVRPEQWEAPGLGVWSVRDLVGHAGRGLLTVEAYLDQPAAAVEVASAADYFVAALAFSSPENIAGRGREAGAALGPDPAATVRARAERVVPLIAAADPERLLTCQVGGMRLADYLPTRTFELVVHTLDLAAAIGADVEPPPGATAACLEVAAALTLRRGQAVEVLLALTGRRALPSGFCLL